MSFKCMSKFNKIMYEYRNKLDGYVQYSNLYKNHFVSARFQTLLCKKSILVKFIDSVIKYNT